MCERVDEDMMRVTVTGLGILANMGIQVIVDGEDVTEDFKKVVDLE